MPQMDVSSFLSQSLWLALVFFALLPLVCGLLALPWSRLSAYRSHGIATSARFTGRKLALKRASQLPRPCVRAGYSGEQALVSHVKKALFRAC